MKEIPRGWELVSIKDVCEIYQGYGFPKNIQGSSVGEFPFYKVGDISKNVKQGLKYLKICENYIDGETLTKLKAKPCPVNTVVFAKIGEALKLNRRAILSRAGLVDNNAIGLKANDLVSLDLYLFYLLNTVKLENYSRATTVPSVRKTDIEEIPFPLPPLPEQHRIVAKMEELFSSLDKGIESLKTAQAQLKTYRQAVLKWAFEGKLTTASVPFDSAQGTDAPVPVVERSRNERDHNDRKETRGELPEGWKWVKIAEVAESMKNGLYKPADVYSEDGIACLRMYNIDSGKILWFDIKRMNLSKEDIEEYELKEGDLLVNRVNSRELVGKTAVIRKYNEPIVYESKNIRLRIKSTINSEYLNYWFLLSANKYFNSNAQQTVGMASINQKQLSNFEFPLPPFYEQKQIVQEIDDRLSVCDKLEETITTALQQSEALRQGILKKAFEGKLVDQNPEDEPASKLLERIKAEKAAEQRNVYRKGKPSTKQSSVGAK